MASPSADTSRFPILAVIALLAAAGGYLFFRAPLETARPEAAAEETARDMATPEVKARLWQDPILAVRECLQKESASDCVTDPSTLQKEILHYSPSGPEVLVLPVMVPDGHTATDHEKRLRSRFAIHAALDFMGYKPVRRERIRSARLEESYSLCVVDFRPAIDEEDESADLPSNCPVSNHWYYNEEMRWRPPLDVPYEWYEVNALHPPPANMKTRGNKILVLWLEEEAFTGQPLHKLALLERVLLGSGASESNIEMRVLGPATSGVLRDMIGERCRGTNKTVSVWSYRATVAQGLVDTRECVGHPGITRVIPDDLDLAAAMIAELEHRGLDFRKTEPDLIAILSEWDTFYGYALPLTFAASATGAGFKDLEQGGTVGWPNYIHRVMYLQGLDGQIPGETPAESPEKQRSAKKESSDAVEDLERAEGRSQLDYARRFADELRDMEREQRRRIKAVGILGSDVYDKILLIEALRDRFPYAVFFTTDLDARLFHPSHTPWTRNLVVASGFGLDPGEELLRSKLTSKYVDRDDATQLPPFRGVYQTSLFISTIAALANRHSDDTAGRPVLFEIGRTAEHELKSTSIGRAGLWWTAAALVLILGFSQFSLGYVGYTRKQSHISSIYHLGFLLALTLLAAKVFFDPDTLLEPLAGFDGISIWPTAWIRLLAAVLAFHFLIRAHLIVSRSTRQGCLFLGEKPDSPKEPWAWIDSRTRAFEKWTETTTTAWWFFSNRWGRGCKVKQADDRKAEGEQPGHVRLREAWGRYMELGEWSCRWTRVGIASGLYLVGCAAIIIWEQPVTPFRGADSSWLDKVALGSGVLLMILLVMFVIDATTLCQFLVRKLCSERIVTCEAPELFEAWWGIRLIARLTDAIGPMVIYPFIVLLLMVLSRLSYFDRWNWPPGLVIVMCLHCLLAVSCALVLRSTAERARKLILNRLRVMRIESAEKEESTKEESTKKERAAQSARIGHAVEDIEGLRQGAFAPLHEQPAIRALLIPFGGIGAAFFFDLIAKGL